MLQRVQDDRERIAQTIGIWIISSPKDMAPGLDVGGDVGNCVSVLRWAVGQNPIRTSGKNTAGYRIASAVVRRYRTGRRIRQVFRADFLCSVAETNGVF